MPTMPVAALCLGVGVSLMLTVHAQTSDASRALDELFRAEWDHEMESNPVRASVLGDRRWNDRWPDAGVDVWPRREAHDRGVLDRLRRIDRGQLTADERVSYDLFERDYQIRVDGYAFRLHLMPFDQRSGIHTSYDLTDTLRFAVEEDYRDWLERLRRFPAYVDGTIEVMREGMRAGVMQPKVIARRVQGQVDRQVAGAPEESPYYTPFRAMPAAIPPPVREALARDARQAVTDGVQPALVRLGDFIREEYLPAAFEAVGLWQAPDGERAYGHLTRSFTTLDLTPGEVHEIGLKEVERIRADMQTLLGEVGFAGTLAEFFTFLRTDPQFYHDTPEELLAAYRALTRRIDPELVRVFRLLPRTPYGVEPIPDIMAPDTTTAYYQRPAADGSRAGIFYVNLHEPRTRPTYEMMALSLHEAVPGHHLQIALAMERDLPAFRRYAGYTAFTEGWALYAESLGDELGLYDDPYSKFGQLTYDMWRAVRLVVDTGMHAFRWDRQRAIDYFMANAPRPEADIVNEIDRYIGWPGQALAYKIGELKIRELRARAAQALGDRFDLREFHEVILAQGAVTLQVLESIVDEWVSSRQGP